MNLRLCAAVLCLSAEFIQAGDLPARSANQKISGLIQQISTDRIAEIQRKLETFGTRNIYSATNDPNHGIGAAREWIAQQFRRYSPNLQVSFDKHLLKGDPTKRLFKDVEIWNVVAILPGTALPDRHVIVSGHYDTINMVYKQGSDGQRQLDSEATVAAPAPGVTDDGSGTAAVMELARALSQERFPKTIVFVAFASEEYGLQGSSLYAQQAAARHETIEGLFNNDIIGSDVRGDGTTSTRYVNVYSAGPEDSASRALARYMKDMNVLYQPGFDVHLVFRHDRFGRGGDHSPFETAGYPAIRITTPMENFSNQHTATDTFSNTAPGYTALVAKANAAGIASLAMAPTAPEIRIPATAGGRAFTSPLSRGGGYDAVLKWQREKPDGELAGYAVTMRDTTAPEWQQQIFVGGVDTYTLPKLNIDEVVLGVKAIGKDGIESPVSAFVTPPYHQQKIEAQ